MSWTITPGMLKKAGACSGLYRKFKRKWPKGMLVTKKNLWKALRAGFACDDFDWAAGKLVSAAAEDENCDMRNNDGRACNHWDDDCRKCEDAVRAFYEIAKKYRTV